MSYVIDLIVACLFLLVSTYVFKNELCLMCGVLVFTHGTTRLPEIESCYVCSMLVSTHGFKNELCYMCTVLVSTHSFKNE